MFEFHGWASLRYHTHDTNEQLQEQGVQDFLSYLDQVDTSNLCHVHRYNGQDSFLISGMHNHRASYVTEIFDWIASRLPGSYGLLYIQDDEDSGESWDHENEFIVWKLARGAVTREKDPFLSPYIPTVEDPYDPSREN